MSIQRNPIADFDPRTEAERFLDLVTLGNPNGKRKQSNTLYRYCEKQWHHWNESCWQPIDKDGFEDRVAGWLATNYVKVTRSHASNVMQQLRSLCADATPSNQWIKSRCGNVYEHCCRTIQPRHILNLQSQMIHLPTFVEKGTISKPVHCFSNTSTLAFDLPNEPVPTSVWLEFLRSQWRDDPESIEALQLWMGYLLTCDMSQQKMLAMIGPRRAGKGVISRVMQQLVGLANSVEPNISDFDEQFGLEPLLFKRLCVFGDARMDWHRNIRRIIEKLLKISGGDTLSVPRKYLGNVQWQPECKVVYISNKLPSISDSTLALPGRFIFLHFQESFYDREDLELPTKLIAEMPGILQWAIEGWRMLQERGNLLQPESGRKLYDQFCEQSNQVLLYARDCLKEDAEGAIHKKLLYDDYRNWSTEQGLRFVARNTFFKRLHAIYTLHENEKQRERIMSGIRYLDENKPTGVEPEKEIEA